MRRLMIAVSAIALAGAFASPVLAQEAGEEAAEEEEEQKLEDRIDALRTQLDAIKDKGADTVEENGGQIEAAIMSASALAGAADQICPRLDAGDYIIAGARSQAELELAALFAAQIHGLESTLAAAAPRGPGQGAAQPDLQSRGVIAAVGAFANLASTLVSSEDTYSAITGTLSDAGVLADMVAARCAAGRTFEFKDDTLPDSSAFVAVTARLGVATTAYNKIAAVDIKERTPFQKDAMAAYEALLKALTTPVDGRLPIVALARTANWRDTLGTARILHLSIEKSGGTLLKRKNLWTGLGASSLGITAGTIVRFRVSDPSNGKRDSGGVIYCTTRQASFKQVHQLRDELPATAYCTAVATEVAEKRARKRPHAVGADKQRRSARTQPVTRISYADVM